MPDATNGDVFAYDFDRKLDRINDTLASMTGIMQEHMKMVREGHQLFLEEVHELMALQKEHRIDIMSLCEGNKQLRLLLEKRLTT